MAAMVESWRLRHQPECPFRRRTTVSWSVIHSRTSAPSVPRLRDREGLITDLVIAVTNAGERHELVLGLRHNRMIDEEVLSSIQ